jgi:hypothetical protein
MQAVNNNNDKSETRQNQLAKDLSAITSNVYNRLLTKNKKSETPNESWKGAAKGTYKKKNEAARAYCNDYCNQVNLGTNNI